MNPSNVSRRSFLRSASAVAVAGAIPVGVAFANQMSPDVRLDAAIEELKAAMAFKYPGRTIQAATDPCNATDGDGRPRPSSRHGILIVAAEMRYGAERYQWFTNYV